jgi:uncharacterized protein
MLPRPELEIKIEKAINRSVITAILGPRQCGKTTISRIIGEKYNSAFYDLEDPVSVQALRQSPMQTLNVHKGVVILDEIQRMPELFPLLRVLADRTGTPSRFLILGSASPHLIKGVSETLAGRVTFIDMTGFDAFEINENDLNLLWYRGGYPRSFIAENEEISFSWRQDFIRTFLERDIPQLGISIPAESLRRFWTMLAHYHGQIWNGSEFARSIGASEPTSRRYLDLLTGAYAVRQIQPWFENISKRQVKSPKIYIRDSGLLHALLMLKDDQIRNHPKLGASWEGFIIEQLISRIEAPVWFWATHAGAELDLFTIIDGKKIGFEIKYSDAPGMTKSMQIAMHDLHLDRLFIIYPGSRIYYLAENILVAPLYEISGILKGIFN